jgi:hypothetical protein
VKDSYLVPGRACLVIDADIRVCSFTRISALKGSMPQTGTHIAMTRRTISHNCHGRCGRVQSQDALSRRASRWCINWPTAALDFQPSKTLGRGRRGYSQAGDNSVGVNEQFKAP